MKLIAQKLTPRERMRRWASRQEVDRIPFVIYADMAPLDQLCQLLGEGNFGVLYWAWAYRLETEHCKFTTREFVRDGYQIIERTLSTPEGTLVEERTKSPTGEAKIYPIITQHMVREIRDYPVLQSYFRDIRVVADDSTMRYGVGHVGANGGPQVVVDRTPFMALTVEWVGPEELAFHMADEPEMVEETMDLMGRVLLREAEVTAASDAPYVNAPDNITAPLVGRERFARYVAPYYRQLAEIVSPKRFFVHMDGDLAPMADLIGESGVGGIDSLSPPPDNDTSVAQALKQWPEMLIGVNFPSSVHLHSPEAIYAMTRRLLEEGGASGRLQIQISENLPPERWRVSFPQISQAIADYSAG